MVIVSCRVDVQTTCFLIKTILWIPYAERQYDIVGFLYIDQTFKSISHCWSNDQTNWELSEMTFWISNVESPQGAWTSALSSQTSLHESLRFVQVFRWGWYSTMRCIISVGMVPRKDNLLLPSSFGSDAGGGFSSSSMDMLSSSFSIFFGALADIFTSYQPMTPTNKLLRFLAER